MKAPEWIDQDPHIKKFLHDLLNRVEDSAGQAKRSIPYLIDRNRYPSFFTPKTHSLDPAYLEMLNSLDHEHHLFRLEIKASAKSRGNSQITVFFSPKMEEKLRLWLERPRFDAAALIWQETIEQHRNMFDDFGEAFPTTPILMKGRGSEEIVKAFASIGEVLTASMTLRELSARCFWGNSKFLDKHRDLVESLYSQQREHLVSRRLLLHCYLPKNFKTILLVENQDSFLSLADQLPQEFGLVYCAGFRGASARLRDFSQVTFSFIHNTNMNESFRSFWFQEDLNPTELPQVYFWGDLDAAAIQLFVSLKEAFIELEPWKQGYSFLLEKLEAGFGHQLGIDLQAESKLPNQTGSEFADQLCEALKLYRLFVDQEAFNPDIKSIP